ncbi:MAG: response regulator [Bacteroidales bacterium]
MTDILIVEDSPTQAAQIKYLLESYHYKVEVTRDGQQALIWLSEHKPSLVISDIVMPEMNGFELCEKIKSDERTEDIPVILLTSLSDPEEVIEGLSCGADSFITKPFNKEYLVSNIKKILTEESTPESKRDTRGIEIYYGGKKRTIRTGPQEVIKFLLNIYRGAIHQNNELIQTHDELRLLNERLEDLLEERTSNLKKIEHKNKLITYSIQYAQRIQTAVLKASLNGSEFFPEQFCLLLPKDIVSGDFYWFHRIDKKILVAVFDCTGHGIPGAFMSILGVTLLNETVIMEKITDPHLILNRLREKIIDALGQKGVCSEVGDGMNGSIISYDPGFEKLVFAGAYNPIYLIRNNEIIVHKSDKMPLSDHPKMTTFSSHEIETRPDDLIYLFTDGFVDQFGGQEDKKFRRTQFKQVLLKNHKNPLAVQKEMLLNTYKSWKGNGEQVDDITVVGLKL